MTHHPQPEPATPATIHSFTPVVQITVTPEGWATADICWSDSYVASQDQDGTDLDESNGDMQMLAAALTCAHLGALDEVLTTLVRAAIRESGVDPTAADRKNDRTDPLAGWVLDRKANDHWHRLTIPDGDSIRLNNADADQFEQAQAITAAWAAQQGTAQRFSAEVRERGPVFLAEIRDADGRLLGSTQARTTRDDLDAFVAQLSAAPVPAEDEDQDTETDPDHPHWKRGWFVDVGQAWWRETATKSAWRLTELGHLPPGSEHLLESAVDDLRRQLAPPAEDLPPGVVRYDTDTLIARGDVVRGLPDGEWERLVGWAWLRGGNATGADLDEWYTVRRIQQPATDRVPLHQLVGRTLPDCGWPIQFWTVDGASGGMSGSATGQKNAIMRPIREFDVDADGMVTVLRDGES